LWVAMWSESALRRAQLGSELRSRHIESRSETVRRRATRFTWVSRWLSIQAARSLHFLVLCYLLVFIVIQWGWCSLTWDQGKEALPS